MIKRNMIKILRIPKYGKTQYDKLFGFFYHIALSKYDKKNNQWIESRRRQESTLTDYVYFIEYFMTEVEDNLNSAVKNTYIPSWGLNCW